MRGRSWSSAVSRTAIRSNLSEADIEVDTIPDKLSGDQSPSPWNTLNLSVKAPPTSDNKVALAAAQEQPVYPGIDVNINVGIAVAQCPDLSITGAAQKNFGLFFMKENLHSLAYKLEAPEQFEPPLLLLQDIFDKPFITIPPPISVSAVNNLLDRSGQEM